jgi:hypothetical protein
VACAQWSARSERPKRCSRRGLAVAIRAADPGVLVVAETFPVSGRLGGDELDPGQPLDALVAVHLRDDHAHGRAVRPRERFPVHLEGEQELATDGRQIPQCINDLLKSR